MVYDIMDSILEAVRVSLDSEDGRNLVERSLLLGVYSIDLDISNFPSDLNSNIYSVSIYGLNLENLSYLSYDLLYNIVDRLEITCDIGLFSKYFYISDKLYFDIVSCNYELQCDESITFDYVNSINLLTNIDNYSSINVFISNSSSLKYLNESFTCGYFFDRLKIEFSGLEGWLEPLYELFSDKRVLNIKHIILDMSFSAISYTDKINILLTIIERLELLGISSLSNLTILFPYRKYLNDEDYESLLNLQSKVFCNVDLV